MSSSSEKQLRDALGELIWQIEYSDSDVWVPVGIIERKDDAKKALAASEKTDLERLLKDLDEFAASSEYGKQLYKLSRFPDGESRVALVNIVLDVIREHIVDEFGAVSDAACEAEFEGRKLDVLWDGCQPDSMR